MCFLCSTDGISDRLRLSIAAQSGLAVDCGACMWNRPEVLSRMVRCRKAGVPVANYCLTIAKSPGILERALGQFPSALATCLGCLAEAGGDRT